VLPPGQVPAASRPYDPQANAAAAVDAAIREAKASGRRVLLDFGGNWCPDCRIVAGLMDQPAVRPWLDRTYAVAMIDVGRFDRNMDQARRFGVKITAVPTIIVLRPDGSVRNAGDVFGLSDARSMSQQAVVDRLASWATD
jgi:thioredoxin 1